jgi:dihydropteroate synthase
LPISEQEELDRVLPLIERLRANSDIGISIDTTKPLVMREAVGKGASLINDIFALQSEGAVEMVSALKVPVCLMHMQNMPKNMQEAPSYGDDMVGEILLFFQERIEACLQKGIKKEMLFLDPGFGFGKTVPQNLTLIREFYRFASLEIPLVLGVSRKSTLGFLLNVPVHQRIIGSIVLTVLAAQQGLELIRTHDVLQTRQAISILQAIHSQEDYFYGRT